MTDGISHSEEPRTTNNSQPIAASLASISNNRIRNLVRGALSANSDQAFATTMARLHRECGPRDAEAVGQILQSSSINKFTSTEVAFPKSVDHTTELPFYSAVRLDIEIAIQRQRLNDNVHEIIEAINLIQKLNSALLSTDVENIENLLSTYRDRFGVSRMVALKAISARNSEVFREREFADDTTVLDPYLYPRREIVIAAFESITNPNRNYFQGRRFFMDLANRGKLAPKDTALVSDLLSPMALTGPTNAARLEAYSHGGIIDLIAFLFRTISTLRNQELLDDVALVEAVIPPMIKEAWTSAFTSLPADQLQNFIGRDDQFFDLRLFSHIPAWSEYDELFQHRINVERAFGRRMDGAFADWCPEASALIQPCSSSNEVVEQPLTPVIGKNWPVPQGGFARTLTLLTSIEQSTLITPNGEELSSLLDQTIDVSTLLTVTEIENQLPTNEGDQLYEYLRNALLNDADGGSTRNHALRRSLEALVIEQFDGDILALIRHIDTSDGHVALHLFNLCSESFLTTLYSLFGQADDIVEAQTRLLEWQGDRRDDADAKLQAKSLRLLIRLRKVRGSIEETRLYVDPLRFFEWVHETMEEDLRSLFPIANEILTSKAVAFNPQDTLSNSLQPRARLLDLVDRSYQEFCTNKVHGAASYVGRRIRHGTFHGHLSLEMQPTILRAIQKFEKTAPEFAAYLKNWRIKFDQRVIAFASDRLHIRTKAKPQGLILASLADPDKNATTSAIINSIGLALRDKQQIPQIVALILDHCWLLIDVDLKRARSAIDDLRREFVIDVNDYLCGKADLDSEITDCIRELNVSLSQRFATAKTWLTRPTNFSPRASVSLMIEAVFDEVSQRYEFDPALNLPSEQDIDLIGHRFHFFYDALYILVVNAAKYGRKEGGLGVIVNTETADDGRYIDMSVRVTSQFRPENKIDCIQKIEDEMAAEIGDAMERDRSSGLRKLRHLIEEADEILDFCRSYETDFVHFNLNFRYLLS